MKNKLLTLLILIILPLSCDDDDPIQKFTITINQIINQYPILITFSIDNPTLVSSLDTQHKLIL